MSHFWILRELFRKAVIVYIYNERFIAEMFMLMSQRNLQTHFFNRVISKKFMLLWYQFVNIYFLAIYYCNFHVFCNKVILLTDFYDFILYTPFHNANLTLLIIFYKNRKCPYIFSCLKLLCLFKIKHINTFCSPRSWLVINYHGFCSCQCTAHISIPIRSISMGLLINIIQYVHYSKR